MYSIRSEDRCREKRDSGWFWSFQMLTNNYKKSLLKRVSRRQRRINRAMSHKIKMNQGIAYNDGFPSQPVIIKTGKTY